MTVQRCMEEGLVGGQGFAVDASLIVADVQKQNSSDPDQWKATDIDPDTAPRAVREYLDALDDEAFGSATTVEPKFTAHADPTSQWSEEGLQRIRGILCPTNARKGPFAVANGA